MAKHNISITVVNSTVGVPQQSNGIMGLFCKAVATTGFNLNTPYLLTQLSDLPAGITAAYDTANYLAVYQQVSEFYQQAGTGAIVWLFGVAVGTNYADFVASTTFDTLIRYTGLSQPLNQVKMIGLCYDVPQLITLSNVFTGSGLNDLTQSGALNAALPGVFIAEVDGVHGIKTVTLGSGGTTTYAINDVLTVVQSGASGGTVKVTTVATGVVTGIVWLTAGTGYSVATALATTGGGGTGCTINVTAVVDTFKYNLNAGMYTTGVVITPTAAQSISDGVFVKFGAALGHTLNDFWTISFLAGNVNNSGSNDFPADVTATLSALQTKQQFLFNQGYQFSALLDGYNMLWSATPETLDSLATDNNFSVSLCITGTKGNGVSAVGMALGRFARISIGHGFNAVIDGPIAATTAFLTNGIAVQPGSTLQIGQVYTPIGGAVTYNSVVYQPASLTSPAQTFTAITGFGTFTTTVTGTYVVGNSTNVSSLSPTDIDALGEAQYMFLRTWQYKSGYYWNDGATATDPDEELSTQETNRVANVLSGNAYAFFINTIGSNLTVNTATGNVSQSVLNAYQSAFFTQYINPLINSGDISGGSIKILGDSFNTTKTLTFTLDIVGTPIVADVTGLVIFTATL